MSGFQYYSSLYKDLISQSMGQSSNIKFLSFQPQQIVKYKSKDIFYVIKSLEELNQFNVGDYIKTEWGRVYKIQDTQIYADIQDCPQLSLLSYDQIQKITDNNITVKTLKLVRVIKKDIKKYFYDIQFDQTKSDKIELISIGIVDQQGNQLYLINKDYDWSTASKWLKLNVYPYIKDASDYIKVDIQTIKSKIIKFLKPGPSKDIKLYGYYSAYDHVCLCKLFGTMNQLPQYIPQYTIDLKQSMDYFNETIQSLNVINSIQQHNALSDAKFNLELYRALKKKYGSKYL